MDINEFKKLAYNLDEFPVREVEKLEFMSDEELDDYQHELEKDTGNLSNWDHLRAFYTLKHRSMSK